MKRKISISIEEESIKILETLLKDRSYRNKSHIIEVALHKFAENKK